jgi:hypothetical protein
MMDLYEDLLDTHFVSAPSTNHHAPTTNTTNNKASRRSSSSITHTFQTFLQHPMNTQANSYAIFTTMLTASFFSPQHLALIQRPPQRYLQVMGHALSRDALAKEYHFYVLVDQHYQQQQKVSSLGAMTTTINEIDIKTEEEQDPITTSTATDNALIIHQKDKQQRVFLHPSTINYHNTQFTTSNYLLYYSAQKVTYYNHHPTNSNKMKIDEKLYLKDTSELSAIMIVLAAGEGCVYYDRRQHHLHIFVTAIEALINNTSFSSSLIMELPSNAPYQSSIRYTSISF